MAYRLPGGKDTSNDFSNALGAAVQGYTQNKKMEAARAVLNNPDSTPMQQALALAEMGHEKIGSDVYKGSVRQAETAALQGAYGGQGQQQEAPRDRSWVPDMSGRTAPIRDAGNATSAQPGAEGTGSPTQPGFSAGAPQAASRNATALDQQIPNIEMVGPSKEVPQGQGQQQDPSNQASQMRSQAGQMNVIRPGSGNALLAQAEAIDKDARESKRFQHDIIKDAKKEEKDIRKETSPYIEGVVTAYKGKKNQEAILNQMEQLASTKELTTPLMHSLMGAAGLPLGVLNNPDSEEFEKLSNNLTRDITKFYGARINQTEFINFLKQIPSLSNSEEGRLRVTRNLKRMLEPIELEYKIMSDMIGKNGGKPFPNMNFQVTQAMEPTLDKWASEINEDLKDVKDMSTPLASDEVAMVFPDGSRKRVPKAEVGKWSQWGKLE